MDSQTHPSFINGDIIARNMPSGRTWIGIFKQYGEQGSFDSYCFLGSDGEFCEGTNHNMTCRPATGEEKGALFDALRESGYRWDAETKTLRQCGVTSYRTAVRWRNNSLVMCNDIPTVDPEIWHNCRFALEDEDGNFAEIFQFFVTDCSESDVTFLEAHFDGLYFTYSPKLDLYVLCVTHFGTSWDCVKVSTDLEQAAEK